MKQPRIKGPRILIAEDHAVFRDGLKNVLSGEFPKAEFAEAENGQLALEQVWKQAFDIVLLDITMPGRSGLEILAEIKAALPETRVLVLSAHPEQQYGVRVLKAGGAGYLTKTRAPREILDAVRKILAGGLYVSDVVATELAAEISGHGRKAPHLCLSNRELEVLRMVASGKGTKEIASELTLSPQTVSTYRARIMEKLGLQNTAQVMRYAIEHELIEGT